MTRAQRMRRMTDDQLVETIAFILVKTIVTIHPELSDHIHEFTQNAEKDMKKWLSEEWPVIRVEEDE